VAETRIQATPPSGPGHWPANSRFWLAILAATIVYFLLWAIGAVFGFASEMQLFAASGLEYVPFVPLCVLAYIGRVNPVARAVTVLYWFILVCGTGLVVWILTARSLIDPDSLQSLLAGRGLLTGGLRSAIGSFVLIPVSLFGVGFGLLIGLLGYLPEVRRWVAVVVPIDAESFVHATGLATVLGLTAIAFVPLAVLGEPPLLLLTPLVGEMKQKQGALQMDMEELRETVYGFVWLVPCTIVCVGYPIRRTFREALERLGLVRPKVWQVGLGLLLVPVVVGSMNGVDRLIEKLWEYYDWPQTNEKAFNELMEFARNPTGAIIIGVTAGIGEELVVRGMLQPRLGIVLSNLFFTGLHALQYNWDGLASVFLIGLILGVVRKYTNTTTSAIVHGGYDFVLVMLDVIEHTGGGT
jgi:membrane protease YdiL (CAAX protease family)